MPDQAKVIVTNTTPLITLTAATDSLEVLRALYTKVIVPYEVAQEIRLGGKESFGLDVFEQASWLAISPQPVGVLLKAKSIGYPVSMQEAVRRMRERGIWLTTMFNKDTPKYETCVACVGRVSTRHGRLKSALQHAILGGCGRCFTLSDTVITFALAH